MTTKQIDKQFLKLMRPDIDAALKAVAEKYGVQIATGNASFSANEATYKLKVNVIGEGGKVLTQEVERLAQYGEMIGLPGVKHGDKFTHKGSGYTIYGLKADISGKHPVIVDGAAGRRYAFPVSIIQTALNTQHKPA